MGSQALGSAEQAEAAAPHTEPARGPARRRPPLPVVLGLFAGAWALPLLTQLTGTDPLLVLVVVFGTGGLLRVGSTVLDRLMATLVLVISLTMAAGLVYSLWPWGLQPVAVGGTGLTLLVAAYLWLGAEAPWRTWPRRVLGSDLALLGAFVAATCIAYGPSWGTDAGTRVAYAGITGDRLRHFNLFDTIHRVGGYTFLKQGASKNMVDPGMLATYPPGQHFIYALADIFLRSNVNPGNSAAELQRYNIWVSLGYGFFVLCVAWSARWVAGPSLAGWRRMFLVTAIGGWLSVATFTSAVWCTWDPQVLGMALLAVLAAFCFRPPRGPRTHIVLVAALCVAIFLTYELFAPFAAILVVVTGFVYRKRVLPHWKLLVGVAVVGIPAALSEYVAAIRGGLQAGTEAQSIGFTIPFSRLALGVMILAVVIGFATSRARRRPTAWAGLLTVVLSGVAIIAFRVYQEETIKTTSYYYPKAEQAWAVLMLVASGTAGHLLRRPRLPRRGLYGIGVGLVAAVLAVAVTGSYWYGPAKVAKPHTTASNPGTTWQLGASTTWASYWLSGQHSPAYIAASQNLLRWDMLGDGVPTLVIAYSSQANNVNLSLLLSTLNHDAGQLQAQLAAMSNTDGLTTVGTGGQDWTPVLLNNLAQLEVSIAQTPVPLRVIVPTTPLRDKLTAWAQTNPGKISSVVYEPGINAPLDSAAAN
ncbi:hypothetical protein KDL01_11755 [Actinospica durhamensis]|uniref:Uncharacterized protein n=1 Tax=Actinospica durhamensis TaxID=1508375 RepID=A0A941EU62_9ACTN|nr:hypothetical protein [Actinospica durhamensis]MBR7833944.1 hypothetical protein [Actinospica durhamensis]